MFKTASAIGTPTETIWAQVHVVGELLVRIEQLYGEAKPGNLVDLQAFLQKVLEESTSVRLLSLTAALLTGKVLYISTTHGEVLLKRGDRVQTILQGKGGFSGASGFVQEGDSIILISSGLQKEIGEKTEEIFAPKDGSEIAEGLLSTIHKADEKEKLVGLVITIPQGQFVIPVEEQIEELIINPSFLRQKLLSFSKNLPGGQSKRVILTVFILLVGLLAASLVLGVGKRREEASKAHFNSIYKEISQKYDEGIALSDLNPTLAQKTFRDAKEKLEKEKITFSEKSKEYKDLTELSKKIDEVLRIALHITTISDPATFFDVTVIKEGGKGKSLSLFEGKMLVLDSGENALYSVTFPKKRGELVSGSINSARLEALSSDFAYVLSGEGIERASFASKKKEVLIKKDDSWGEIAALSFFAGNLYMLDKENGAIYKYQGAQGEKRSYLGAGVKPDFGSSIDMEIDGAVWVLNSNGRGSKFVQGSPESFSIDGIDTDLNNPTAFFTDDETEHLYILDSGNKRIVVVKKDGTYISQYQWEGMGMATDLVVSEKEKKILLLSGSKIYEIEL